MTPMSYARFSRVPQFHWSRSGTHVARAARHVLASCASDRSAPRAFSVTDPAIVPDSGAFPDSLTLATTFAVPTPTSVHASLDIKLDSLGLDNDTYAQSPVFVALTHSQGGTTTFSLAAQLSVRPTLTEAYFYGADPEGGFGPSIDVPLDSLPIGVWVHVDMELTSTSTGGKLTVSYDGKSAGEGSLVATPTELNAAYFEIGARNEPDHPRDFVCAFDNVLLDAR